MRTLLLWSFGFIQLLSIVVYLGLNISAEGGAKGTFLLLVSVASFGATALMVAEKQVFYKLPYSLVSTFIFLIYFLLNFIWDAPTTSQIKEITIGTSGGVIFAILSGLMSAMSMAAWNKSIKINPFYLTLTKYALLAILFVSLLIVVKGFMTAFSNVRADIFLIADQKGIYQRPGQLMLMLFILLSSLFSLSQVYLRKRVVWSLTMLSLLTLKAIILMAFAQLIASNSGFVTVAVIMLAVWVHWLLIGVQSFRALNGPVKLNQLFFSWIFKKLLSYGLFLITFISIGLAIVLAKLNIDISSFRIFGFGSGSLNSVDSRLRLLQDNFLTQWAYSPIFGHTQVDALTTGKGSYPHSLISILTHLGLVGAILFIIMITFIYRDIYSKSKVRANHYHDKSFALFRLFIMTAVLLFALMTTFYNWMPLWFTVGLLGVSYALKE